jgi:hypothetical protein
LTVETVAQNERDLSKIVFTVRQLCEGRSNAEAQFTVLSADYTLSDVNTAQQAFNATTDGALRLLGSMSYEFEAQYLITNSGTTSHTWAVLFGGTATFTSIAYVAQAHTSAGNALTAVNQIYATVATATVVTAASTSATENVVIKMRGVMRIANGGTVIPQVKLSAATGGTEKMLTNSYFRCWPIGSNTITYSGQWS